MGDIGAAWPAEDNNSAPNSVNTVASSVPTEPQRVDGVNPHYHTPKGSVSVDDNEVLTRGVSLGGSIMVLELILVTVLVASPAIILYGRLWGS